MAAGISSTAKSLREETVAIQRQTAGLHARIAEQDRIVADLSEQIAQAEAAQASPPAVAPAPLAKAAPAPPPDPRGRADAELSALAILAQEHPEKGSRQFWRQVVGQLGRHLAPDATPAQQTAAALADPRAKDFVAALQSCAT